MPIRVGLHLHQFPAQFEDWLRACRRRSYTVLDIDAGYYIPLLDTPDTQWTIRLYHPDMPGREPEEVAGAVIAEALKWRSRLGDRVIYQSHNEINLGIEWGGNHALQPWLESEDGFQRRAEILLRTARNLKQRAPWVRYAGPFDSPGHQDIDGRVEIRQLAEMGYLDYLDAWGAHHYAEGVERGGFDAPDREWYADRVLQVRALLDSLGYDHLPIIIGECNRKDTDVGDLWGEYERYLSRIDGAVERIDWFIWSSPDAAFGSMQLWKAPDPVNRFNRLADKFAGASIPILPPVEPVPPAPPAPAPSEIVCLDGGGNPTTLDALRAKYGIEVTHGARIGVVQIREDWSGSMDLRAYGPAVEMVNLDTLDGLHGASGRGEAVVVMAVTSAGRPGPWIASCRDARVTGLGWLGGTNHHKLVVTFGEIAASPPSPPPPAYEPEGAFAAAYQAHWGAATSPAHYAQIDARPPEQRQAVQFFANGVAIWTGSSVRWTARGT